MSKPKLYKKTTSSLLAFLIVFQTVAGIFLPVEISLAPPYVSVRETQAAEEGWYNTGGTWGYRKAITIDQTKVSNTDQTDFPILINRTDADWKDTANSGNVGQADGGDILFTSSDGTIKLSHEIEKYDNTTGELAAWVKIPTLSVSADTIIYIYYGDATITDSTVNANNGTKKAANEPIETTNGKIDGAQSFDGTDDYISVADAASLDITNQIAIEALVDPSVVDGWNYKRKIALSPATPEANYQVKVELNTSNFDYSKAQTNGEDLRFYQTDGTSLDYWIEIWDTSGTSTVWVEVATSMTDTIYMYYGNPSASSASDRSAVFSYKTYDFTDAVNNHAYYGKDLNSSVPVAVNRSTWNVSGTEFTDYTNISSSDNNRSLISADVEISQQLVHDFVFKIDENSGSNRIYSMTPFWEGYGSKNDESEAENDLRMYFLNTNTSAFELKDSKLDNSCPGTADCSMTSTLNSVSATIANYFSGTDFRFLVQKYETVLKDLGVGCGGAGECLSGYCVDGVCCDTVCDGTCVACNVGGSEGTCANVPINTDPDAECGGSSCCGYCNGGGGCTNRGSGTTCTSPGSSCTATHYRCNGGGSCTAPTTTGGSVGILCSTTETCNSVCIGGGHDGANRDTLNYCSGSYKVWRRATSTWSYDSECASYGRTCDSAPHCNCWDYQYDSPLLYSFNGSTYELVSDFSASGKENEKTYFVEIPKEMIKETEGKYRIKVKGDENEIAYLDKIYLKTTDTNHDNGVVTVNSIDPTYTSKNTLSLITESDDNYLILNPGEEVFLEFDALELRDGYQRKIEFVAKAYYIKIKNPEFQESSTFYEGVNEISEPKSLAELLGLESPFEKLLKENNKEPHNSLYTDYVKVKVEYRKYVSPEPIATVGSETIPSLPACILTVSPTAIHKGDSVSLTWSSINADSVVSSNFEAETVNGSASIVATGSATYNLIVSGMGETGSCSASVSLVRPQGLWIMDKLVKDIIKDAISWAVNILAILAILMVVVGGLVYTSSSGDLQRAEFAKKIIFWALGGLAIAGISYAVIVLVEKIAMG